MKKYYVYKIREKKTDKVLYIGETRAAHLRWRQHVSCSGLFNRNDHYMDIIDEYVFSCKKDAFEYQCELQKHYGFETDFKTLKTNAINGGYAKHKMFVETGKSIRPVLAYCYKTNKFIGEYKSTREAQRKLNVSNLNKVLNKSYKQVGGYYFEYK